MTYVYTYPPLTVRNAIALSTLCEAAIHTWKVARLIDGDVIVGLARSIGDERGNFAGSNDDIRGEHLRVTTLSGFEAFWPVADLIDEVHSGFFVAPYES